MTIPLPRETKAVMLSMLEAGFDFGVDRRDGALCVLLPPGVGYLDPAILELLAPLDDELRRLTAERDALAY